MEPLRRTRAGGLRQCGGRGTARCDRKADGRTLAAARGTARQALVARPPVRAPSRERSRCRRHSRRRDGRRRRSEPTPRSTRDRNTTRGPICCAEPLPSTSSSVPLRGPPTAGGGDRPRADDCGHLAPPRPPGGRPRAGRGSAPAVVGVAVVDLRPSGAGGGAPLIRPGQFGARSPALDGVAPTAASRSREGSGRAPCARRSSAAMVPPQRH